MASQLNILSFEFYKAIKSNSEERAITLLHRYRELDLPFSINFAYLLKEKYHLTKLINEIVLIYPRQLFDDKQSLADILIKCKGVNFSFLIACGLETKDINEEVSKQLIEANERHSVLQMINYGGVLPDCNRSMAHLFYDCIQMPIPSLYKSPIAREFSNQRFLLYANSILLNKTYFELLRDCPQHLESALLSLMNQ